MSLEEKAYDELADAITKVMRIPRPEWRREVWEEVREFCEEQLKDNAQ